jgi:hypothetical protein
MRHALPHGTSTTTRRNRFPQSDQRTALARRTRRLQPRDRVPRLANECYEPGCSAAWSSLKLSGARPCGRVGTDVTASPHHLRWDNGPSEDARIWGL